jgi:hypothetical protein
MIGKKVNSLTVISKAQNPNPLSKKRATFYLCKCDCGNEKIIRADCLKSGNSKSCGCLWKEKCTNRTHGASHGKTFMPEYKVWTGMKMRCQNPNAHGYKYWGGRGIKLCERWQSFENFIADMGPRPSDKHSIDRIDNDKHYEPGNCHWVTRDTQRKNQRWWGTARVSPN